MYIAFVFVEYKLRRDTAGSDSIPSLNWIIGIHVRHRFRSHFKIAYSSELVEIQDRTTRYPKGINYNSTPNKLEPSDWHSVFIISTSNYTFNSKFMQEFRVFRRRSQAHGDFKQL